MYHHSHRTRSTLTIHNTAHDLQVFKFTGEESISTPYSFDIELVSEEPNLDLEALLHKQAFLAFNESGDGIHGQIYRIGRSDGGKRLTQYNLTLVPRLAYLRHCADRRIFQHQTVAQIIAQTLEGHGIHSDCYRFQLGSDYPAREYCVQYDESDLHFIQRLCQEEGLHYHFQHSDEKHVLVFGDDQTVFPRLAEPTPYKKDNGMSAETPVIQRFDVRLETRTSRTTRRDYNFEKAGILLESGSRYDADRTQPDLEDYDYPGRFFQSKRGKFLSQRALERHRADYCQAHGQSDQPALVSGHFLQVSEHSCAEWNDLWLLTEISHECRQPQVLEEGADIGGTEHEGDFQQGYRNHFVATPWSAFYRPQSLYVKPRVSGSQTAVVTGPKEKRFTATNTAESRSSFSGTERVVRMTKAVAGCACAQTGQAAPTAVSPSQESAWKCWSVFWKETPINR